MHFRKPYVLTESVIIPLDAGLRLDGIPALDLWDLIVSVLGNTTQTIQRGDFRTVQQNQKSFPWMQDSRWTVYPRLIYGI